MTTETSGLRCPSCHYSLDNLTTDRCPECGQRFEVVQPPVTRLGSAPLDWRYWGSIVGWVIGVLIYLFSWFDDSIFWFNFGTGYMLSLLTLIVILRR